MSKRITHTDTTLNMSTRITVRLSNHLAQELNEISRKTGAERSLVLRAALQRMVEDYNRQ